MDEFNRTPYTNDVRPDEVAGSSPNQRYEEFHRTDETSSYREFGEDEPTPRQREGRKRRRDSNHAHIAAAAVVIAAVAVLALVPNSILSPMFEPFGSIGDAFTGGSDDQSDTDVTASFDSLEVTDVSVRYSVTVSGGDEGDMYTVTLTNRFTDRSQTFTGDSFSSSEMRLRPGMEYTLAVIEDGMELASATFTTERAMGPYFYLVSAECTCITDGMFHLSVDMRDGGVRSDFRAELTDLFGNVSSVPITELTSEVLIPVTSAGLTGDTAVLRVFCTEDAGDGPAEVLLYSGVYMI